jgi:Zn-dependent protease
MQGRAPSGPPRGRMPGVPGRFGMLGRVLGDGENPLRWGIPVARVAGVRVRIHWLFVVYAMAEVIFTLPRHQTGVGFVLPMLAALFVLVLLHEFGHCLACRRVGGEADEIVLWPLGGLAMCRPPHEWRAELWTTLGGPLVNAALLPVFAGALIAVTGSWRVVLPNPLDLGGSISDLAAAYGSMPWWLIGLWSLHIANLVLLVFNMLVPMYPLDAGRLMHCLLWPRVGYHRSLWVTVHVGLAMSALLVAAGLVLADGKMLLAIGLFGGVVCWMERRQVQFLAGVEPGLDVPARPAIQHPAGYVEVDRDGEPVEEVVPPARTTEDEGAEVDRILEKISRSGMNALTSREKRVLKRATERSRETESPGSKTDQ